MARRASKQPTDGELEILKVLWDLGPAGLGQIHEVLFEQRGVAITTVATMLKMMLAKDLVERTDGSRGYLWRARVSRKATISGLIGKLVQHVFDGSAHRLVAHLVQEGELDLAEREEIAELLRSQKDKKRSSGKKGTQLMSFKLLSDSPVWTAAGWTMVHLVWVGAVAGVLAALSRRLMRRAGPEIRHAAALCWLIVLAVSPAAIFVCVYQPAVVDAEPTIPPVARSTEATGVVEVELARTVAMRAGNGSRVEAEAIGAAHWQLESVVPYLPAVWLAGSLCALMLLLTGLIGVSGLRRSSQIITSGELPRRLRALADSLHIARQVSIGMCDRLAVPVLIGVIRPLILLPPAALCGWSTDQLEMVLLHELAHLRRWDNVVNILQRLVESVLFFHPVVWWLTEWLSLERESCCDRLVVGRSGGPVAYAEVLVALAGLRCRKRAAVLAMADRMVMARIRRLFKVEDQSMKLTVPEGIGLLGAAIVGTLLVFAAQAGQQEANSESPESVRQALQTAAGAVSRASAARNGTRLHG